MIIEFFGPPASGKTTLAHALAGRLRDRGYMAKVILCYQPRSGGGSWSFFGLLSISYRIYMTIISLAAILTSSFIDGYELKLSNGLVNIMPPEGIIWRFRIWQYIMRLSRCWKRARKSTDIAIFDQGFVQAVGSLAMFNGAADDRSIAQALHFAPQADLVVRMVVPRDVVEARLRARMMSEPAAERLFEVDVAGNMNSFGVFDDIGDVLSKAHRNTVSIQPIDQQSTFSGLRRVEEEILARLCPVGAGHQKAAKAKRIAGQAQAWKERSINDRSEGDTLQYQAAEGVADSLPLSVAAAGTASIAMPTRRHDVGRRLVHASIFALLVYIGGAGLTSMAQFGIARLVGATSYGIYSYSLAWSTILASLSMLGFNISLLRFVPAYKAAGRLDLARGVITFALWWSLSTATLAGLAGAAFIVFLPSNHLHHELQTTMLLGMAAVPLITAYALGATLVRAFGGVVSALLPERVARDGLLLALLGGAAFSGGWTLDAPFAMMAIVASSAVTVGLVFVTAMRLWPAGLRDTQATYTERQWWSAVPPTMLVTGLDVFISRTGVVLLGSTGQVREAGIFALGLNVALLVGLSSVAVSTMFSPTAADLHARKDHEALQRLFSRAAVLSSGGALAIAVPLLLVTEPLLRWFGEDFAAGALIARILIMGYVCTALCGPQLNLLTMTGHEWAAATTMVAGAIANIVACAVGMELDGSIGAASGVVLALVVWNSAMAIYIRKRLNILPGLVFAALALRSGQLRARWG